MFLKLILVLVLIWTKIVPLLTANDTKVTIDSTTKFPSKSQQVDERLTKLEERMEFHAKLTETNHRLEAIELQNKQLYKTLETLSFAVTNQSLKVTENSQKLETIEQFQKTLESQNKQMQKALETIHLELTHQNSTGIGNKGKVEAMELQNQQIRQKLENMKDHTEKIDQKLESIALQNDLVQIKIENMDSALIKVRNEVKKYQPIPRNCKEIQEQGGNVSKIYQIKPVLASESFSVWCDMETRGGGWTYLANRFDGPQDFNFEWGDYKKGFGNLSGEFWLGLEHFYELTDDGDNELLFNLIDENDKNVYAHYTTFRVGNEKEGFIVKLLSGYSGDAGDAFVQHLGRKFNTKDTDNQASGINCAREFPKMGGWWDSRHCFVSVLTCKYDNNKTGIYWNYKNMKQAKMMVRRRAI